MKSLRKFYTQKKTICYSLITEKVIWKRWIIICSQRIARKSISIWAKKYSRNWSTHKDIVKFRSSNSGQNEVLKNFSLHLKNPCVQKLKAALIFFRVAKNAVPSKNNIDIRDENQSWSIIIHWDDKFLP